MQPFDWLTYLWLMPQFSSTFNIITTQNQQIKHRHSGNHCCCPGIQFDFSCSFSHPKKKLLLSTPKFYFCFFFNNNNTQKWIYRKHKPPPALICILWASYNSNNIVKSACGVQSSRVISKKLSQMCDKYLHNVVASVLSMIPLIFWYARVHKRLATVCSVNDGRIKEVKVFIWMVSAQPNFDHDF